MRVRSANAGQSSHIPKGDNSDVLDLVNQALLSIPRNFLDAYLVPEKLGWRYGLAVSGNTWGEARGLAIANHCQLFVGAILN